MIKHEQIAEFASELSDVDILRTRITELEAVVKDAMDRMNEQAMVMGDLDKRGVGSYTNFAAMKNDMDRGWRKCQAVLNKNINSNDES
jgi:hypothetical protein